MGRMIRAAIVIAWAVLVAMLLLREHEPAQEVSAVAGAAKRGAVEEWVGVYREGSKIGYARFACEPEDEGYRCEESALVRMIVMGTSQTVRTAIHARTDARFVLRSVDFELTGGEAVFRASGRVDGERLVLLTRVGEDETRAEIPLKGPVYLPSTLWRSLDLGSMQAGKPYEVQVFDPSLAKEHGVVVSVRDEEAVPGTSPPASGRRVEQEYAGVKATAWIDAEGRILREEGPLGFTLLRETAEEAVTANWTETGALDLVASVSIPVSPPIEGLAERTRLRMRIGGIATDMIPVDERQHLDGDVLTVVRETVPHATAYDAPYGGTEWKLEIQPSPLLQSDHPRIRALAAEVIGGERRPAEIVRRLLRHVHERLEKVPTLSVPNALQVLEMGKGDCNEHAVLLAGLARAAGVPARVAAGIVYVDGAFAYHAWNEVWLDRWIAVDPTFDQFPADVAHVKFATGGPEDHLAMIGVIGRLSVLVLPDGGT